jgi:hypothetical protein
MENSAGAAGARSPGVWRVRWHSLLPWMVTIGCFAVLYRRLLSAAATEGRTLVPYLVSVFERVSWWQWLALMVPYCLLFFLLDTLILSRLITRFNASTNFVQLLPVRASAYILSIVNEQISKGAIALYVTRTAGVPAWEVGSTMLFVMFCEYYSLLAWATAGVLLSWQHLPAIFHGIPWIALASGVFFLAFRLFLNGVIAPRSSLRELAVLRSFKRARLRDFGLVILLRAPVMLGAVVVYTLALRLFGVSVGFAEMLGYLPVIFFGAAVPGPMHSVAVLLWVVLFPDRPGEMATFGMVQHNFFVLFNAAIGLFFVRGVTRDLLRDR